MILLFALVILIKIVYVQFVDGDMWRKKALQMSVRPMKIKATRGNIFSDNGSLLATSLPFYKLAMDPTPKVVKNEVFKEGIDSLSLLLSRFFKDRSPEEYKNKIRSARANGVEYLVLNNKILNYQEKKIISQWPIFRQGRYKGGAIFEKQERRFLPFGSLLAGRTIGFVNEDKAGAGLEASFDKILQGRDGSALFRMFAGGSWKIIHDESEIEPVHGYDIQTTLDVNLQDVAETSLREHLVKNDADYGCAVLMEVKTGSIKAMANLGKTRSGDYFENYNYAVGNQGLTDPGSTFKLASMLALFEETDLELSDSVNCEHGSYRIYDRILKDAKPEGYGYLTIRDVFAKSSNIGVAKLILKHFEDSPSKYRQYITRFGLDRQINFQLAGEATPYIKSPGDKSWSGISLPWMSIGYELKLSPIQTLTFYNAVANKGKMIKPMIVSKVYNSEKVVKEYKTEVMVDNICSESSLEKAIDMMTEVVESGTAQNIRNEHYKIAGKTGTAQIIKNGVYTKNYYTSFCGFFPVENPKYSCIVVISNPKGFNQMGSDVSAPVFKEIADKIYSRDPEMHKVLEQPSQAKMFDFPLIRSGYSEDLRVLLDQFGISNHSSTSEEWVKADITENAITWRSKRLIQGLTPDVTGLTIKDALFILENRGLKVRYYGEGRVISQSVSPGRKIIRGASITLKLG